MIHSQTIKESKFWVFLLPIKRQTQNVDSEKERVGSIDWTNLSTLKVNFLDLRVKRASNFSLGGGAFQIFGKHHHKHSLKSPGICFLRAFCLISQATILSILTNNTESQRVTPNWFLLVSAVTAD